MESRSMYLEKRGLYLDTMIKCEDPRGDSHSEKRGLGIVLARQENKGFFGDKSENRCMTFVFN
jgi:hypothetical protein